MKLSSLLKNTRRGPHGCRIWTGSERGEGYGQVWDKRCKRQRGAHVVAWELTNGRSVPKGMHIAHACDVRRCVEPTHLRAATPSENERDKQVCRYQRLAAVAA